MLQVFHLEPNIFLHLNVKSRVIRLQDSPQKPIESTKHLKSDVSAAAAAKSLSRVRLFATPYLKLSNPATKNYEQPESEVRHRLPAVPTPRGISGASLGSWEE